MLTPILSKAVGYGNQAPGEKISSAASSNAGTLCSANKSSLSYWAVTDGGRTLVACLAWISIITWGMILYVSGQVVSIIMDDFFRKCHVRFMTRDIVSAVFWGVLGLIWIVIMSELGFMWWTKRVSTADLDRADSLWWAYISILTVYVLSRSRNAFLKCY